MCTTASEYMRYTSVVCHELVLGLPHYMCGVTGTVNKYRQWNVLILQRAASNGNLPLTKCMGVSLLINIRKCT